jgi:Rrf2 family protein
VPAAGDPASDNAGVHISAKAEYAMRALLTLAAVDGGPMTADRLAAAQDLPVKFLENILVDLRRSSLVRSQRGNEGGYRLARPAREITVAEVLRIVDGPLAEVRGTRPDQSKYEGPAEHLQDVWIAGRAALLSPFDRLAHDRVRALELFDFEYTLEMYKPAAKRRWGYFALPVLHHDRLVGKLDAVVDRRAGVLRVHAFHPDVRLTKALQRAVDAEVAALARWLGVAVPPGGPAA